MNRQSHTKFISDNCRPGIVAEKIGMTSDFSVSGVVTPVTVLRVVKSKVLGAKDASTDGYNALVVAYGDVKAKNVNWVNVRPETRRFMGTDPDAAK